MKLRSVGYRSDLIFTNFDGEVFDRGDYLVVKTPVNPNYFWGNLLIFDRSPRVGDFEKWKTIFVKEFDDPRIYHLTFAWDSPEGDTGQVSEFLENGFNLDKGVVLTAQKVQAPKKMHSLVVVKPIESNQEWEDSIRVQTACGGGTLSKQQWEGFYRSQMDRYRKMVQIGLGQWFGAFVNGKIVGGLGIFTDEEIGRYQIVGIPIFASHCFPNVSLEKIKRSAEPKKNFQGLSMK
jgi:hypothetical protein